MKKLSKAQSEKHADLVRKLRDAWDAFEEAITEHNDVVAASFDSVVHAEETFNEALTTCREFADEVHTDIVAGLDDKSDKYRESDAGQAVAEFASEWESIENDLERVNVDQPDVIEVPDVDVDAFENLPTEANV